ncbi:hypothetical protein F9U64_01670 [Gracilibacillus oryzae]|uniref:FAD/FMN-containing dehydrogenase n=1 Tax=Gracilibacillus oryzae TaxID=1672701 RepID=A0A7C8GVH0_9BACI|nr:hypothetical protein [Gracilibacillus oryzae]KAB8139126.1 hypothetical protein F9U64_01670 [Gracilibacillus oryzae]
MKKKIISLLFAVTMVLGVGNVVFAHNDSGNEGWRFEEMLHLMKEMHPKMDQQDMKQMYQECHG